jgi:hypothetical protein
MGLEKIRSIFYLKNCNKLNKVNKIKIESSQVKLDLKCQLMSKYEF